jgi:hypothetical protein
MTQNETSIFELLDAYARTRHRCFLAEMTLRTEELGYWVCFRPLDISENSDPYACKYLMVPTEHVRPAGRKELPPSLVGQLDAELSELKGR